MQQVQQALATQLEQAGAELVAQVDEGRVAAPLAMLTQVLQNLISNACKYRGEAPLRILVSGKRDDERWIFTVDDNGIGIPATAGERVFDMFHRLRPHETTQGTGIGLTICRKVVERLGGALWFEPLPVGSRFTFALPVASEPPQVPTQISEESSE
jgi:signal transduction histidine kinase